MAAQYYISGNDFDTVAKDPAHVGTSSTSTDLIELRVGDGTTIPTYRQVFNFMEMVRRFYIESGVNGAGANLPPNRG